MKKTIISMLILLSTIFIVSCSIFSKFERPVKEFSEKNSNSSVSIPIHDKFNIELDANATTGYQWEIVHYDKKIIKLIDSDYIVNSELMGAPGKQQYAFKVIGKGTTELKINYHRSWEKDVKPAQTFELKIKTD